MIEQDTPYGQLLIGRKEELFAEAVRITSHATVNIPAYSWALTGGSTPQDWYRWCVSMKFIPKNLLARARFTVSDERHTPLNNGQSNFGTAARLFLDPLGIEQARRHPWPVELAPQAAAETYKQNWRALAGEGRAYDVCFLGLGEDAHTASLFPNSPLLTEDGPGSPLFAAVEVPGKGWRLTVTPAGLRACGTVVVMALGAAKAPALRRVLHGPYDPSSAPAQILKTCAARVKWLVDESAMGQSLSK